MQPLISVIVPVYNGQDYLENCIESIEAQTYENLEIFVINDGSTDGTAAVCEALEAKFDNIHIITMEDEGVSAARNAGLDRANGAFITFVDADDRLRPKTLEILSDCIMQTGSDIAGCKFAPFHTEGEWQALLQKRYQTKKQPVTFEAREYLRWEILKGNSRCWSKLYRRSLIGKLRFERNLTIGEDMLFLVGLLPYVRMLAEVDYPGYGYYQNPGGAMKREFTADYMDQITCWEKAREKADLIDKGAEGEITTILLMAIMLVAGKIAFLPAKKRREQRQYIQICREKLKEALRVEGAFAGLSKGYRLKVTVFGKMPGLYLALYHFRKYFPA